MPRFCRGRIRPARGRCFSVRGKINCRLCASRPPGILSASLPAAPGRDAPPAGRYQQMRRPCQDPQDSRRRGPADGKNGRCSKREVYEKIEVPGDLPQTQTVPANAPRAFSASPWTAFFGAPPKEKSSRFQAEKAAPGSARRECQAGRLPDTGEAGSVPVSAFAGREIPGVGDDRHARACFCACRERATDRGEATETPRGKIADPALSRLQTQNTVRSCQKYDAKFRRRPPVFSRAAGPSVRFAPAPCSREKCLLPGMESRKTSVSVKPVDACLFLRKACRAARSLTNRAGLFIMQMETNFPYFYGL